MLTKAYIEAPQVDEELADMVWESLPQTATTVLVPERQAIPKSVNIQGAPSATQLEPGSWSCNVGCLALRAVEVRRNIRSDFHDGNCPLER